MMSTTMSTTNNTLDRKTPAESQMIDLITPGAAAASTVARSFTATATASAAASVGSATSIARSNVAAVVTRLKDLPANILRLLPSEWDKERGINEPINAEGTTPLMWVLNANPGFESKDSLILIFNALLACPDLDPNKGDGTTIPLNLMKYRIFGNIGYVKRMLIKGADPTIIHKMHDKSIRVPLAQNEDTKFLNTLMLNIDRNSFNAITYRQNPANGPLVDLLEHIWHHDFELLESIKGATPLVGDLIPLVYSYTGSLDDFSIRPLSDAEKTWILESGKIFHTESLKEAEALQAENERQAREKQAYADAANRKKQALIARNAAIEENRGEIGRLKETVNAQAIEIKQMKEQLAAVQAQVARLLQGQAGVSSALPGYALSAAAAAAVPTPSITMAPTDIVPPKESAMPMFALALHQGKPSSGLKPQSGPDSGANAGIDSLAMSPEKVNRATGTH